MAAGDMDPLTMIRLWPIVEVKPAAMVFELEDDTLGEHEDLFVFADWSLCVHGYAVRLKPPLQPESEVVFVVGARRSIVVAPNDR
jgi:hypothetical protein